MPEAASYILYEHPLNEQIRTYLRLENLFNIQQELQSIDSVASHIAALHNLWEILDCLDRGDLKAELLKELEQQKNHFKQLEASPYIDDVKLKRFLEQLQQLYLWVANYQGKFGATLRQDRFIDLIKHRIRIPGASCSFDLPELHQFLQQPVNYRQQKFNEWFEHFDGLNKCLKVLLRLYRENGQFIDAKTINGSYQHNFDKKQNPHLIRVKLPIATSVYPEISGSKYCFTVRFIQPGESEQRVLSDDTQFQVAIC